MNFSLIVCFFILLTVLPGSNIFASNLKFGLLAKNVDDENFIDTAWGCQHAAALNGDTCVLLGGRGSADPRSQVTALKEAVKSDTFAAFAISVVMSDVLGDVVRQSVNVPVISFDSPFLPADAPPNCAYVGPNNYEFGRDLAKIVKQLRPQGGTVFLMGDLHDPNLKQRVWGIRRELSENPNIPDDQRLTAEAGWSESRRSPWNTGDNIDRAMEELSYTLEVVKPDVFISVGQWPLVNPAYYRKVTAPFRESLIMKKQIVVVGVGKILPVHRQLVDEGLVHGLVSIDFNKIGQLGYQLMRDATEGKPLAPMTYISNTTLIGR